MPTNRQRLSAVVLSAAILVGGAWAASLVPSVKAGEPKSAEVRSGLTVTVQNIRNSKGQVIVMVMNDRDAFKTYNYDAAVGYQEIPASTGSVKAAFPDLVDGPYAVIAFHDENKNRDLDLDGEIPLEGYALSGARDAYDEPSFKRAASSKPQQDLQMHYLK